MLMKFSAKAWRSYFNYLSQDYIAIFGKNFMVSGKNCYFLNPRLQFRNRKNQEIKNCFGIAIPIAEFAFETTND